MPRASQSSPDLSRAGQSSPASSPTLFLSSKYVHSSTDSSKLTFLAVIFVPSSCTAKLSSESPSYHSCHQGSWDLAEGRDSRWHVSVATADRVSVATADRDLSSELFPGACDTEGSSRGGSDTCSGEASATVARIGVAFDGEPFCVGVGIGTCGGSLGERSVGSGFDGGACFCGGA